MSPERERPPLNIQTIVKVESVDGIVEATLTGFFDGFPDSAGEIRLRFEFDNAKSLADQMTGALISAQMQLRHRQR